MGLVKLILFVLLSIFIYHGCSPSSLDKAKQDFACKDHGGVYRYVTEIMTVTCVDGTAIANWETEILPPEYYEKVKTDG